MHKTLHKVFTKNSLKSHTIIPRFEEPISILSDIADKALLQEAARELLQPRPEAIAELLRRARGSFSRQ